MQPVGCSASWGFALALMLHLGCSGAACGGSHGAGPAAPESKTATRVARIEAIPQVEVKELTDAERLLWIDLVNDQLSPCGEPVSIAKCATVDRKCGACVTAARYLGRLVMDGYDRATLVDHYRARFGSKDRLELAVDGAPSRGAPMAKVTIVAFSDFQCPHCGAAHPEIVRLLREFDGRVRLVYKYFPLSGHPRAQPAARAVEAARAQGKFWEMHDLLFEHQRELEDADLRKYAQQLGLAMDQFERDWSAESTAQRVDVDRQLGIKLGIEATPSFFVNGRPFRESPRNLAAYIKEELEL